MRDWANLHGEVFVVTGPVLSEQLPSLGPNEVSVPEYYYKVVVDLNPPEVEGIGFILPNGSANQSIDRYAVTIDSVEVVTGFDFFPDRIPIIGPLQVRPLGFDAIWGGPISLITRPLGPR